MQLASNLIFWGGGKNIPIITADTTASNALQAKTWIDGVCAARGYVNAYIMLAKPAAFVENTNQVFGICIDGNGGATSLCRQRTTANLNVVTNLTSAYDAVVKDGDIFAVITESKAKWAFGDALTVTADIDCADALQVKNWIEGVCSTRGFRSAYFLLVCPSDFVENTNQVMALAVGSDGAVANGGIRQRTTGAIGGFQYNSSYDAVVKEGDVFAVIGPFRMRWQDGLQYNNVGTPIESADSSIGLDYIPITAGHSFTWRLGYGSSASADLIIYNANKERIDYWVARDRTVTISGAAAYMRVSALSSYKEQATVFDETAQQFVFMGGIVLPSVS